MWTEGASHLQWAVVLIASGLAAIVDASTRRIPNWLTGPVLLSGLTLAAWTDGVAGFGNSAAACVLLAALFTFLWMAGAGGAGDAKLMAAIGAWVGTAHLLLVLICVLISGGVLGIAYAVVKRRGVVVGRNLWNIGLGLLVSVMHRRKWNDVSIPRPKEMQTMPYGVAIFVGTLAAAIGEWLWQS